MNLNHNRAVNICKSNHTRNPNLFNLRRPYSTTSLPNLPIPILTINSLHSKEHVVSKRNLLVNKAGIYSFLNNTNGKQYIGSAKDLYLRLNERLALWRLK